VEVRRGDASFDHIRRTVARFSTSRVGALLTKPAHLIQWLLSPSAALISLASFSTRAHTLCGTLALGSGVDDTPGVV